MEKYFYLGIGVLIIIVLIVLCLKVYFSKGNVKGREAEKKTYEYLKKISKRKNWKIINNVYLPLYKKTCEYDHIVIADFGVLIIETKGISGTVSGSGKTLTHKIGSKTHKLYNPQLQNKTHQDNLTHHLKKGNLSNIPIYAIVVFTANDIILNSPVGIYLDNLEKEIKKLPASKCNVDKVYSYIKSIQVRNPLKKLLHKF